MTLGALVLTGLGLAAGGVVMWLTWKLVRLLPMDTHQRAPDKAPESPEAEDPKPPPAD